MTFPRPPFTVRRLVAPRAGMTLLELVVVLVLMGLGAAFVLPAITTAPRPQAGFDDLLRSARASAIARAQSLTLDIGNDGRWSLRSVDQAIDSGVVRGGPGRMTVALSALGHCVVTDDGGATRPWDAARCAPGTTP